MQAPWLVRAQVLFLLLTVLLYAWWKGTGLCHRVYPPSASLSLDKTLWEQNRREKGQKHGVGVGGRTLLFDSLH